MLEYLCGHISVENYILDCLTVQRCQNFKLVNAVKPHLCNKNEIIVNLKVYVLFYNRFSISDVRYTPLLIEHIVFIALYLTNTNSETEW
jgi:hypothetical protein